MVRAQQRVLVQPLGEYERKHPRKAAIALAYLSGQHTMATIAEHFGVHYTTVSRIVSAHEKSKDG